MPGPFEVLARDTDVDVVERGVGVQVVDVDVQVLGGDLLVGSLLSPAFSRSVTEPIPGMPGVTTDWHILLILA